MYVNSSWPVPCTNSSWWFIIGCIEVESLVWMPQPEDDDASLCRAVQLLQLPSQRAVQLVLEVSQLRSWPSDTSA